MSAYRPAQVMDIAQALSNLMVMPTVDHTLMLPGLSTLTYEYLLKFILMLTYNPLSHTPAAQHIWWPVLSPDEVEWRYIDNMDMPGNWAVIGIEPDKIENHTITYVHHYHSTYAICCFCGAKHWHAHVASLHSDCNTQ